MTSFRILGGQFKGRSLQSPKTSTTRPTKGILRQSVFNICRQQIAGARFLDLFAGSGAMGLEALSQGALKTVFVEQDLAAARCIRSNIRSLNVENSAELLVMPVIKALQRLIEKGEPFDIIYIDPPYDLDQKTTGEILHQLESTLVASHGLVFLEESSHAPEKPPLTASLVLKSSRRFGITRLYEFEK